MKVITTIIVVSLCFGLAWLSVQPIQENYTARTCDSFTTGLTSVQVKSQFGVPDSVQGKSLLIGAPSALSEAEEVWTYKFSDSTVQLGFKMGKCFATYSAIKPQKYDQVILWCMKLHRFVSPGPTGNSEKLLAVEFDQPKWSEKGMAAGSGG